MTVARSVAVGIAIVVATWCVSPAAARNKSRQLAAVKGPVRIVSRSSLPLTLPGLHSYFGTIELEAASDGVLVVNRLSLERYLLGLQEVPPDWPVEALRAQAIAARTYALWSLENARGGTAALYGFDICASVECQVFAGADVVRFGDGRRWADAVASTTGRVVSYQGRPILARYHSTSGGATLDNEQGFPEERSYPYLQAVMSPWERAAPLFRWRVRFRLDQLQEILVRSGLWTRSRNGRLVRVHTIPSRTGRHFPDAVLNGTKRRRVVDLETFREALRVNAPALYPSKYPSRWPTSSGFLPETLPSDRVDIETDGGTVIVIGRGWGHGVGLSQWGAYGLALRGANHEEILEHYYTGVDVDTATHERPIDVGLAWGESSVAVRGEFDAFDGRGRVLARAAVGTWRFSWEGQEVVSVDPPQGYRLPLRVGVVSAPHRAPPGTRARLTIALSRPSVVRIVTESPGAEAGEERVVDAGRRVVVWRAPTEPGRYAVRVEASSGGASKQSEIVQIVVPSTALPAPESAEPPSEEGDAVVPMLVLVGILLVGAAAGLARRMRT